MKNLLLVSLSLLLMVTSACAKHHKHHADGEHFFSKVLKLDEKQSEEIKGLIREMKKEKMKLRLEVEKRNITLKEEMMADMNLQNIKSTLEDIAKIKVQKQFLEFETDAKIRQKLTEEQWSKYVMHKSKMDKGRKYKKGHCECRKRGK